MLARWRRGPSIFAAAAQQLFRVIVRPAADCQMRQAASNCGQSSDDHII
jgi:hypothetical protein